MSNIICGWNIIINYYYYYYLKQLQHMLSEVRMRNVQYADSFGSCTAIQSSSSCVTHLLSSHCSSILFCFCLALFWASCKAMCFSRAVDWVEKQVNQAWISAPSCTSLLLSTITCQESRNVIQTPYTRPDGSFSSCDLLLCRKYLTFMRPANISGQLLY